MFKHLLTVSGEVFGIENWQFDIVLPEKVQQRLLALDLREAAKVSVTPEKVEGVKDQPVLPARRQLRLQFGEVGSALMGDHHFSVDDGLAGNIEGAGNGGEPLGPVQPVSGVDLLPAAVDVDLDAVAVELDLMKPLLALGSLGLQCRKLGLNEPRHD